MDDAQRATICQLIAGILISDDDITEEEDHFIDRLLLTFELPPEHRDELFPIVDAEEAARKLAELDEDAQQWTFQLLAGAAAVDGEIAEQEREYLDAVANAMGLSQEEVEQTIELHLSGDQLSGGQDDEADDGDD